jgi:CubicO group peptidase (beta-lactamase class C family)
VYRIASITKQFTAIMLTQLLERHQVHLADPVERYLPEVRRVRGSGAGSAGVTLVQLATMTSGLARDPNDWGSECRAEACIRRSAISRN